MRFVVIIVLLGISQTTFAQKFRLLNIDNDENESHLLYHCSDEAEEDCKPCLDTIHPLPFVSQVHDIGLLFPTWKPVVGYDSVSVIEGVMESSRNYPSVSAEDLPIYHYTHDMNFNIIPDEDYRHFLSYDIIKKEDGTIDTILNKDIHIEWETGLGQANRGNICSELNRQGKSCGFFSAGHERSDTIWNWPTGNDWVHVEGLRVWDRGHPPAASEIHPARFVAVRRNLPEKIKTETDTTEKFATRVDIFASGDGGAFDNNRPGQPAFVRKVEMSSKDYVFTVKHTLPKPSENAILMYKVRERKGNSFNAKADYKVRSGNGEITISIPWKSAAVSDDAIFAKTVYLYWDEAKGVPDDYKIEEVKVKLSEIVFDRFHEALGKAEIRMFVDIGGNFIFMNDFAKSNDILKKGFGKTRKKKWKFDNEFTLYIPQDKEFRVSAHGFEADGIDKIFGHIIDNYSPCTPETKKLINKTMIDPTPVGFGGCLDDPLGNALRYHSMNEFPGKYADFVVRSKGRYYEDGCPCSSFSPNNLFSISYRVEHMP